MDNKLTGITVFTIFLMSFVIPCYSESTVAVDDRAKLGEVYSLERLKQYDTAMPTIEDLHQHYIDNREVTWTYVRVLGFGGHWKEAIKAFEELCAAKCDEEMFVTYAHILEAQGPKAETLVYIKNLADQHPDQLEIQSVYAEILSWKVQNPQERQIIEELSTKYPNDLQLVEALGDIAYSAKDYVLAQQDYEKVLEKNQSSGVIKKYANILVALKKYPDAIAQMDTLLSRSPRDNDLRFQHAQIVSATGDHKQAVKELQALLDDGDTKKEVAVMLGDELRLSGRNEEALKIYKEVVNGK
jgi:predicted Zn-dependent protease